MRRFSKSQKQAVELVSGNAGDVLNQGQSYTTEEKLRGFATLFEQQLAIAKHSNVLRGSTYVHIDLHAGCGYNRKIGHNVKGSPLVFRDMAAKVGLNDYLMLSVDKNKHAVAELARHLENDNRCFPFFGDNAELCDSVPELLRAHGFSDLRSVVGSVLMDPNGLVAFPWDQVNQLMRICPRLDVIVNYPGLAMIRNYGHPLWVDIEELPKRLHKTNWFIREPLPTWYYTIAIGRNTNKVKRPASFVEWDSEAGRRYRRRAVTDNATLRKLPSVGQLELFT